MDKVLAGKTKDLRAIRDQWLRDYFKTTASIWEDWKKGYISYKEREETLHWYRGRLKALMDGPKPPPVLQRKPRKDDEWLEDLKI
jgi:hypothetical protein